ncbi:hypothetical protein EBU24_02225 [bacterium]|nr:hypothetical protein [bacterium]
MNIFKAAILERLNSPLVIKNISCNDPEQGQVLVKILTSGLCGAQLQEIAGLKGNANFLPHLLGHEGCGIVEKVGPAVSKVKVGDKVVLHWKKSDGIESSFPTYYCEGQKIGGGKVTTLSEYSLVSENRMTVVGHETPNDFSALLGCGLSTALGTINYEVNLNQVNDDFQHYTDQGIRLLISPREEFLERLVNYREVLDPLLERAKTHSMPKSKVHNIDTINNLIDRAEKDIDTYKTLFAMSLEEEKNRRQNLDS